MYKRQAGTSLPNPRPHLMDADLVTRSPPRLRSLERAPILRWCQVWRPAPARGV